jgi:MATE family multidrug resistance protein
MMSPGEIRAVHRGVIGKMVDAFRRRWSARGGYREVLAMAFPLILSTATWSLLQFTDRMFLTWYSPEAVAASAPAGVLNYTLMSLFIGTAGYVSTFVAQYHGAGRKERIGPVLWQGLYVSLIGGALLLFLAPASGPIFRLVGHSPALRGQEEIYFRILCYGGFFPIASATLAGFFSGRGQNWPVMWNNALSTGINILLDYAMIFGYLGFPRMGIAGAAAATVIASAVPVFAYLLLLRRKRYRDYFTRRGWRFDRELFVRLLRFGLPNGIQFFLDMSGFTIFLLLMGRLGTTSLAATNIAFNVNSLAFMPMIGCGIAVSVLVGQYLGENQPALAERSVYSGFHLTFLYMSLVAVSYVLAPDLFLAAFSAQADPARFEPIRRTTVILLRFVALYSLFDTMNIVFASAIKGAGDTRYVMLMIVVVSLGALVVPSYTALVVFGAGVYAGWIIVTAYVIILALGFLLRFLGGKWKTMRVIETPPHSLPPRYPAAPSTEFDP